MSDVPEQAPNPAVPLTRRERRAHAQTAQPALPRRALVARPLSIAATIAFAALVALTGYASPRFVALAVALAGFVLAWGWPLLLSLPSPRGTEHGAGHRHRPDDRHRPGDPRRPLPRVDAGRARRRA